MNAAIGRPRLARGAATRSWAVRRVKKLLWDWRVRRTGWLVVGVGGGARLRLPCDDRLAELIYFWDFERTERDLVAAALNPGDVFVDVGANLGLFTVIAGKAVGSEGRVFAFEPSLTSYQRLLDNVTLNHLANTRCLALALSDMTGQVRLHESTEGFDAWNSIGTPTRGAQYTESTVSCVRWDDFAKAEGLFDQVTMMKIDVEGSESRVLLGGKEFFSRNEAPILQVEFCDSAAASAGSSCTILYRTLISLGYTVARLDPATGLIPDDLRAAYPYENLYAVKDLGRANARLSEASW